MHASIEQLLELRERRADSAVAAHVGQCGRCREELERLEHTRAALRALPEAEPAGDPWADIRERAAQGRPGTAGRGGRHGWLYLGLAASLVVATLVIGLTARPWQGPETALPQPVAVAPVQPEARPAIGQLVAESRRLERLLRSVPYEPRVVNFGTAGTIAQLEDQIALVDYGLSMGSGRALTAEQANALWERRVELMNSLVQVRYAQAQRIDF